MSAGGGARLFVAVDLPEDVRDELAHWGRAAAGAVLEGRPVTRENLHLTLCFLGSVAVGDLGRVAAAALGCAAPVAGLQLGAPAWLPPRRPRALAVSVADPTGGLTALQGDVAAALAELGVHEPEHRTYRPHVTVVRMRAGPGAGGPLAATPAACFDAPSMTVYRSHLGREGARYEPLEQIPLA